MRNFLLIASAAAMAVSMPALAEKGGKGGGGGGGKPAHAQGGGHGGGKAHKGGGGQGGGEVKAPKMQRQAFSGGGGKPAKAERQFARGSGKPAKAERHFARGGEKPEKAERHAARGGKPAKVERAIVRNDVRRQEQRVRDRYEDRRGITDPRLYGTHDTRFVSAQQGCPPGLAKKGNGCLPPGQAKKAFGLGDRIQPAWFSGYQVPDQYRAFYHDTPEHYYRYDDNGYIYRVDSGSNLISGLVPLLGGGFAVGQALPAGYDVYNVPLQYRDNWSDSDDAYYRYADDAIYQVDPQSGIIESIVALLGGGLNVGEALPTGYDVYNVPMDYRDQYQDTDESMYRYADGNIYEVDTKTQIIQAIVEMLV